MKNRRDGKGAKKIAKVLAIGAMGGCLAFSTFWPGNDKALGAAVAVFDGASEGTNGKSASKTPAAAFKWTLDDGLLTLRDGGEVVFSYRYSFLEHENVPKTDSRRGAGCYLYPLNGVDGENLTDLAPKDHYHHRGVFWTWPAVGVWEADGTKREYDLWTTNAPIRQRFLRFLDRPTTGNGENGENGGDFAEFAVENGWFVGPNATKTDAELDPTAKDGQNGERVGERIAENAPLYGEKVVTEIVRVKTGPIETFKGVRCRSVDVEIVLIPNEKPISLRGAEGKSYGGLTIRFRPVGKNGEDRFILTDEGLAKGDMPEKPLRWADFTSRFGSVDKETVEKYALSGAAIFLSPNFPDFPPTWLTRYYGPLCVGWPGVVEQKFEPGERIEIRARIWLHEGLVAKETLQKAFERWAEEEKTR
ncbi:MAG: PmoA family protein [Thermoguttaceae bacterium]|nr:PmoA family protein [Thermoguttaceae bacterium]